MSTPNLLQQGVLVQDKQYYSPNTHITESNLFAAGIRKEVPMDDLGLVKTWTQIFRNVQPLYFLCFPVSETFYYLLSL